MKKWRLLFGLIIVLLCLYGCALNSQGPGRNAKADAEAALAEKTRHDNEVYRSYEERNTLEDYREFVEKYPDNINLPEARKQVERLEYDTCEEPACLREFISKYPESQRIVEARERLNTLTVKDLDRQMQKQYGFDLLLYRLNLKNLQKELIASDKGQLASFMEGFSMIDRGGKKYFNTSLVFSYDTNIPDFSSSEVVIELFDEVLSPQLDYLQVKFKQKDKIDGFSFEILLPPFSSSISALKFYFSTDQVKHFLKGSLSKEALLKTSLVRIAAASSMKASAGEQAPSALAWTSAEDGTAKGGEFRRTSAPAFSLQYPGAWSTTKPTGDRIFEASDSQHVPSIQLSVLKTGNSLNDESKRAAANEYIAKFVEQMIIQSGRVDGTPRLEYAKSAETHNGFPVYEFLLTWRLRLTADMGSPHMSTYGRMVFTKDHALIMTGTVMAPFLLGRYGGSFVSQLKSIFNTLTFSKDILPPETVTASAQPSKPAPPPVIEQTLPLTQEIVSASPLALLPVTGENVKIEGQRLTFKTPSFAFTFPQEWAVQKRPDHLFLSRGANSSLPSIRVMVSKITGDERAFLEETANRCAQSLKMTGGSRFDFIYNIPTEIHEKHQAFEFEIRYKPQSEKPVPPRTVYGNVIAKDGYAIILEAETEGEIDTFKTLFETIELNKKK